MRRNLRRVFNPLLPFLFAALVCFSACNSNDLPSNTSARPVNSAPPKTAFPMPPTSGASINNLGWTSEANKRSVFCDFRGKVLILDFYATWCDPCRRSIPHLIELQKKYENQGLQVVGLNVGGEDDPPKVPAFAKELGIEYTLALPDEELITFLMGDSDQIPQTYVFDRQGQLAERLIGYGPNIAARLDRAVEAALKTPAP